MNSTPLPTNANFQALLTELSRLGVEAQHKPIDDPLYQQFIARFPAERLPELSLPEYCVGKKDGASFCWWIERGLEPLLGRYMPGSARGHLLFFQKDGTAYKNRLLKALSDEEALRYTLRIQACIAQADMRQDPRWIDSDAQLYERAGVVPRVTMGSGRKLRLLACYHPNEALPMSSSAHVGHFLQVLGCPEVDIPPERHPVARMLVLRDYLHLAQQTVAGVSPVGFMRALYAPALGLAPVDEEDEADDDEDQVNTDQEITVRLSLGAVNNGYVKIPKDQSLFPADCIAEHEKAATQLFSLALPDGQVIETYLLANRRRIKKRFGALFKALAVVDGDLARIQKSGERRYVMSFERQDPSDTPATASQAQEAQIAPAQPLNQILYGPPGTGKTYSTIDAALAILDPGFLDQHRTDRTALKSRFDALTHEHRIRFVTFHQSFSYEDFVEGLRATTNADTGQIRYEVVDGVFKSLCEAAAVKVTRAPDAATAALPFDIRGRRIWKMSLGNTLGSDAAIYDECIEKGYALLGYGAGVDFTGCSSRAEVLQRCLASGVQVENPQTDYSVTSVTAFVTRMKPGDLLIISDGNFKFRAIGEVSGEYKFQPHSEYPDDYAQMRAVKWLRVYEPSLPHGELMNSQFSQMTLYELRAPSIDLDKLQALLGTPSVETLGGLQPGPVGDSGYQVTQITKELVELAKPNGNKLHFAQSMLAALVEGVRSGTVSIEDIRRKQAVERLPAKGLEPFIVNGYNNILAPLVERMLGGAAPATGVGAVATASDARVLIIDEINRGNISRIFGELITLIEPSKRAGADETLEVVLPYSKQAFSVPKNVYLIGTMNTADRSLTGMDVALRRRFVFKPMPPRADLLEGLHVQGISISPLLSVLNLRIEALLDRDHCLGHAYFMPLWRTPTLDKLGEIFSNQVLPLLQEYFFDDWQRIQWVLNDHRKSKAFQFVSATRVDVDALFGADVNVAHGAKAWTVNDGAFLCLESYLGVIDHGEAQASA